MVAGGVILRIVEEQQREYTFTSCDSKRQEVLGCLPITLTSERTTKSFCSSGGWQWSGVGKTLKHHRSWELLFMSLLCLATFAPIVLFAAEIFKSFRFNQSESWEGEAGEDSACVLWHKKCNQFDGVDLWRIYGMRRGAGLTDWKSLCPNNNA